MLLGEGTYQQAFSSQALEIAASAPAPKKMTPKKAKRNLHLPHVP
jgi:hypothetical protein